MKPARVGALHLLTYGLDARGIHRIVDQRAFFKNLLNMLVAPYAFRLLVEPRLDLWVITIADSLHQQVPKRLLIEEPPQHVVNLAA